MYGFLEIRYSGATTNSEANPMSYHCEASHTSSPISKPLLALLPTASTIPAHDLPIINGNSGFIELL